MNQLKLSATFISTLFLFGCSKTDSENIRTKGIRAEIAITSVGSGLANDSEAIVRLYSGSGGFGGTLIELSEGDSLIAVIDGESYGFSEVSELFDHYYQATLPTNNLNTEYKVSFVRDEGVSATESIVTLPDEFEIDSSTSVDVTKNDTLPVNWSPSFSGENLTINYSFDCTTVEGGKLSIGGTQYINDDGAHTFDMAELVRDDIVTCDGKIDLKRINKGTIDPNFGEGGRIEGIQKRRIDIDVTAS